MIGAICLPNEDIIDEPEELADKSQKILVYCRSGNRSKQAAAKLADMGYENVLEFWNWKNNKYMGNWIIKKIRVKKTVRE